MKRKIIFLSLLFCFVYLTGCSDKEDASLEVNVKNLQFSGIDDDGGSFYITSNAKWTVSSGESWLRYTPASGEGNGGVIVSADYNQNMGIRTGSITISAEGGLSHTIQVMQLGSDPAIIVSRSAVDLTFRNADVLLYVNASEEWEILMPNEANEWITVTAETTVRKNAIAIIHVLRNLNEQSRKAELIFRLKTKDAQFRVTIDQDLLTPPTNIQFGEEAYLGDILVITGKGFNIIDEVWFGDVKGAIASRTATEMTVNVPVSANDGLNDLKIVYADNLTMIPDAKVNLIFADVTIEEHPKSGVIGRGFKFTGDKVNLISKVLFGNAEALLVPGATTESLEVIVPLSAKAGQVELKVIFPGNQTELGTVTLTAPEFDPTENLALFAGSTKPGAPSVTSGRNIGFNAGGGRSAMYAFDGVVNNIDYEAFKDNYPLYYNGIPTPPAPNSSANSARTYWQANSGDTPGEIPNGQAPPANRIWITLNYSPTDGGTVIFDQIGLIPREGGSVVKKYLIEISLDNLNWTRIVKPEETQEFPNSTSTIVTHQLEKPVVAKYIRWVCVESSANNTGLTNFYVYRTKQLD